MTVLPNYDELRKLKRYADELKRRQNAWTELIDICFPEQRAFIEDPSPRKAALCTRRAGKSHGMGANMIKVAMENPYSNLLYIALTNKSAKRIMIKDVLRVLDRKFELKLAFNENEGIIKFPNGSVIYLMGLDASGDEKEKVLGQKFKLVVIDECASFKKDLYEIVYSNIEPATIDDDGQIVMIGTPGNVTRGLFYDVTTGREPGWSLHKWTVLNNPHVAHKYQKKIDDLKRVNPLVVETPRFKQMYLGEWAVDDTRLVYKYRDVLKIPEKPQGKAWTYILGVDLGYEDDTAFVLMGWSRNDNTCYVIECFKAPKMDLDHVEQKIKHYYTQFGTVRTIIDCSAKQAVETLRKRFHTPLVAAVKPGKAEFISLVNSDMIMQRIRFLPNSMALVEEMKNLLWDENQLEKGKQIEKHRCPNHLCDAFLYAYRDSYHYAELPSEQHVPVFSEEYMEMYADSPNKSTSWWDDLQDSI